MSSSECQKEQKYSGLKSVRNNIPYVLMILLGALALAAGLDYTPWAWTAAGAYAAAGVGGALWIIIFVCPHCVSYGRTTCPCGYGTVASWLAPPRDRSLFATKFRRHIMAIVPMWFIPLLAGVPLAIGPFSWLLAGLLVAFVLDSFVVLPLVSLGAGCKECPQRDDCPWMARKPRGAGIPSADRAPASRR